MNVTATNPTIEANTIAMGVIKLVLYKNSIPINR